MVKKPSFSERRLIECLNIYYNIEVASMTPLLLGADMTASVYKTQGRDQKSYFVKLKTGHNHDSGVTLLDLFHNEGMQQIIPPIKTSQGRLTQHIDEYTLIAYPYIDHQNGFNKILTDDQWVILGNVLRKVHEFKIPASIQDQISKEHFSPQWREFVRSLYEHIEIKYYEDPWAKKLTIFMKEHKKEIYRLLDTAELFAEKIQHQSAEFVLCHADIHGGNVLISENGSIYIVDWDQPIMAPKERDLMFIGGGIANVWNNPNEEEFFYKGYGKTEINMSYLAYYRHERIIEDIAEYAKEFLFSPSQEDRSEMYQHLLAMFDSNGVVDIAFRTKELDDAKQKITENYF